MSTTNNIETLLIEAGCDGASIEGLVDRICQATKGKEVLAVGIAAAIYLKFVARQLCADNNDSTNLNVLLDLADAYDVDIRRRD